jgi:hypothetical protein
MADLTPFGGGCLTTALPSLLLAFNTGGPATAEIVFGSAGSGNEAGRRWTQETPGGGRAPLHVTHERRPA